MNRSLFYSAALILAAVGAVYFFAREPVENSPVFQTISRRVFYTLALENSGAEVIPLAELWAMGPNRKTAVQETVAIKSDYDFRVMTDDDHNQVLHFQFANLPPYGKKIINVEAQLLVGKAPPAVKGESGKYLDSEQFVETSDNRLIDQAKRLAGDSSLKTVENIHRFVSTSLTRTPYAKEERGALYALLRKNGDCTEFMHLSVALCRINEIPARAISGFIVDKDQRLDPDQMHDWAEVFLDGRWRVVDPFNKVFMEREDQYLVMQLHGKRIDGQPFRRWRTNSPALKASMIQ